MRTMFKQFSKVKRELVIDNFENSQIALEFFIKDIKIRKESLKLKIMEPV